MARILLVEDDEDLSDLLVQALRGKKHTCVLAKDGREGAERVLKAERPWDLIITDLHMPRMSGGDLIEEIHEHVKWRTPVVIVSGVSYMIEALGEFRRGAFSILKKPFELKELYGTVEQALKMRRAFRELQRLRSRVKELKQSQALLIERNQDLFERARLDPLTDLPNRRQMDETLRVFHDNATRYQSRFAVAFLDVDRFGRFNKEYDYQVGDSVIRRVASTTASHCRQGDMLYRWGGDEFVLILSGQDLDGAVVAVQRLVDQVASEPIEVDLKGTTDTITLSAGVAEVGHGEGRTLQDMMHEATACLKQAKAAGGNCVRPER